MAGVVEFFSGVGGWRYALDGRDRVAAAYDIHPWANATYTLNHGERPRTVDLSSLPAPALAAVTADTWVLSPPCQPFCRMGNRTGLADPRSRAFLHLMDLLDAAPPRHLALENVVGFLGSDAHARLVEILDRHGFHREELSLCASAFGLPNNRPRVYVVASRDPLDHPVPPTLEAPPVAAFLDAPEDASLYLPPAHLRHTPGLDLVEPASRRSACFIGGYGQRFLGSGSFLVTPQGIRRFSPAEVARLLGYPPDFAFPDEVPLVQRYKLLGNGLSLPVARWVLAHLPL